MTRDHETAQHVQRDLSLTCIQILDTIEALRNKCAQSSSVPLNHLSEVTAKVLTVLRDMNSLPEDKLLFFEVHQKDIAAGGEFLLDILKKSLQQVPNHFGVFESGKYKADLQSCKTFLGSISLSANQFIEGNEKQNIYNLYKELFRGHLQHMSLSNIASTLHATADALPELPSRLFWLRSFGLQRTVSWEAFLEAFLADYQCVIGVEEGVAGTVFETNANSSCDGGSSGGKGSGSLCSEVIDCLRQALVEVMNQHQEKQDDEEKGELEQEEKESEEVEKEMGVVDTGTSTSVSSPPPPPPPPDVKNMRKGREEERDKKVGHSDKEESRERAEETGASVSFQITRAGFAAFCEGKLTAYGAFQAACDPCTLLLCAGQVMPPPPTSSSISQPLQQQQGPYVLKSLLGYKVTQVACGGQHVAVVTSSGKVFTWGKNSFGQLGHGTAGGVGESQPRLVAALRHQHVHCTKVACGFAFSGAVSSQGEVYMWGVGEHGRLGLGDERDRKEPTLVPALSEVVITDIQAGSVHTSFLSNDGTLYSCGKFEYNGHGLKADLLAPRPLLPVFFGVQMPRLIQVSVNPGGYHSIALTDNNEVYTWGHNRCGQLGYYTDRPPSSASSCRPSFSLDDPDGSDNVSPCGPLPKNFEGAYFAPTPRRVFLGKSSIAGTHAQVVQVAAGWGHSAVLLRDGSLFMCGRNEFGQLGLGAAARRRCRVNERGHKFEDHFCLVTGGFEAEKGGVRRVECGAEHSLVVCGGTTVYGSGKNSCGQVGVQTNPSAFAAPSPLCVEQFSPIDICLPSQSPLSSSSAGKTVVQASCGSTCSLLLLGKQLVSCLRPVQAVLSPNPSPTLNLIPLCEQGTSTSIRSREEKDEDNNNALSSSTQDEEEENEDAKKENEKGEEEKKEEQKEEKKNDEEEKCEENEKEEKVENSSGTDIMSNAGMPN